MNTTYRIHDTSTGRELEFDTLEECLTARDELAEDFKKQALRNVFYLMRVDHVDENLMRISTVDQNGEPFDVSSHPDAEVYLSNEEPVHESDEDAIVRLQAEYQRDYDAISAEYAERLKILADYRDYNLAMHYDNIRMAQTLSATTST